MKIKSVFLFLLIAGIFCFFSGCSRIPGREPFGEHTYSEDHAQTIYANVRAKMEQIAYSDWNAYAIEISDTQIHYDFYQTEEYTTAWYEGEGKEVLWYQGRLYCKDGEKIAYRDMDWEELQTEAYAMQQWDLALALLAQDDGELTYKHIPMASNQPYLLTIKYPQIEWDNQRIRFPTLSFGLDETHSFHGFTLCWQDSGSRVIYIEFSPYEHSTNLQAERKIWSFAHEIGLLDKGVPALATQQENREWSHSIITGIDFTHLLKQAKYQEDLTFPTRFEIENKKEEGK